MTNFGELFHAKVVCVWEIVNQKKENNQEFWRARLTDRSFSVLLTFVNINYYYYYLFFVCMSGVVYRVPFAAEWECWDIQPHWKSKFRNESLLIIIRLKVLYFSYSNSIGHAGFVFSLFKRLLIVGRFKWPFFLPLYIRKNWFSTFFA